MPPPAAFDALPDLSAPLRVPAADRSYTRQFASVYDYRLAVLRRRVLDAARARDPHLPHVGRILDTVEGQHCFVVGAIYAAMPFKPDVLEEVAHSATQAPALRTPETYADPERDALFIEDESGRVRLVGERIARGSALARRCVTGVVVGVYGVETPQGDLHVEDVLLPGIPPRVEHAPAPAAAPTRIALMSGLGLGASSGGDPRTDAALDVLAAWLAGELGGERIRAAVIAGNCVAPAWRADRGAPEHNPFDTADPQIARLCAQMDAVVLLPGGDDPTSLALPQQPLLSALVPRAAAHGALELATNPAWFALYGRTVLATAGQNIDDLRRYAIPGECTPLDAAALTLASAHIAPTAPDTLWSYPFKASDPFVLRAAPDLYVVGNQPTFATEVVGGAEHAVRVVLVPRFDATRTVVLVDPASLACEALELKM